MRRQQCNKEQRMQQWPQIPAFDRWRRENVKWVLLTIKEANQTMNVDVGNPTVAWFQVFACTSLTREASDKEYPLVINWRHDTTQKEICGQEHGLLGRAVMQTSAMRRIEWLQNYMKQEEMKKTSWGLMRVANWIDKMLLFSLEGWRRDNMLGYPNRKGVRWYLCTKHGWDWWSTMYDWQLVWLTGRLRRRTKL